MCLHRYLQASDTTILVVDSSSIEVNRHSQQVRIDCIDVGKLLIMLIQNHQGEKKVWGIVHVPNPEVEDQRQLHRPDGTQGRADPTYQLHQGSHGQPGCADGSR